MKDIIIKTHHCSREEYVDLITYLQDENLDFKEVQKDGLKDEVEK